MGRPYTKVARNESGQIERTATAQHLIDLSNIFLWKDLLRKSGHMIDQISPPESSGMGWEQYQIERDRIITHDLTNAEIGTYCRKYEIRMHGRLCPSFF